MYPADAGVSSATARLEKKLTRAFRESARLVRKLRATPLPAAWSLASRLESCAARAELLHRRVAGQAARPYVRLGKPCSEPICPVCRLVRQRRSFAQAKSAFGLLLERYPDLRCP